MVNGNIELRKRRGEGLASRRAGKAGSDSLCAARDSLSLSKVKESAEFSWQNNYCSAAVAAREMSRGAGPLLALLYSLRPPLACAPASSWRAREKKS